MPGKTTAIIVAAGRGSRLGGELPKQWQLLAGRPVLQHAVSAFDNHPEIHRIIVVLHADDMSKTKDLVSATPLDFARGGDSRGASVLRGLQAAAGQAPRTVLIHDAARPLLPPEVIDRLLEELRTAEAAAPALRVTDALWTGDDRQVTGLKDPGQRISSPSP